MTLREALKHVNLGKVYRLINQKDQRNAAACDRPTLGQTELSYVNVITELLSKKRAKSYKYPWYVKESRDPVDKKKFVEVLFLNPDYVAPVKGLKPWGGKNPPKGHYNCNLDKHNEFFGAGWTPWSKMIDTEIMHDTKFSLEKVVAEILWEITFYGWTEKTVKSRVDNIKGRIDEATKEIKEGKFVTLPPKKKGGYKIVIPDVVTKQLKAITDKCKKTKKCNSCEGYGLWSMGDASPMGPMDASDGMPTKACPECGANKNPSKK